MKHCFSFLLFHKFSLCGLTICLPDLVLGVADPEQSLGWGGFGGETGAGTGTLGLSCVALFCSDSTVGMR